HPLGVAQGGRGRAGTMPAASVRLFFFFSSRRRHTRCLSDWSSDVCSSDLEQAGDRRPALTPSRPPCRPSGGTSSSSMTSRISGRSEERRVGKEYSSRGGGASFKEKGGREGRCAAVLEQWDAVKRYTPEDVA